MKWQRQNKYYEQCGDYRVAAYQNSGKYAFLLWYKKNEILGRFDTALEARVEAEKHNEKYIKKSKKREKPEPNRIEVEAVALKEISNMRELLL